MCDDHDGEFEHKHCWADIKHGWQYYFLAVPRACSLRTQSVWRVVAEVAVEEVAGKTGKKKKGGKAVEEEEDLDALLASFGVTADAPGTLLPIAFLDST